MLDGGTQAYADSLMLDGKLTRVRHADGIHLAMAGQKRLAQAAQELIRVQAPPSAQATP